MFLSSSTKGSVRLRRRALGYYSFNIKPDFSRKANRLNIKVLQYSADNHAELWDSLAEYATLAKRIDTSLPENIEAPFHVTKRYLAACYARVKSHGSAVALESP